MLVLQKEPWTPSEVYRALNSRRAVVCSRKALVVVILNPLVSAELSILHLAVVRSLRRSAATLDLSESCCNECSSFLTRVITAVEV